MSETDVTIVKKNVRRVDILAVLLGSVLTKSTSGVKVPITSSVYGYTKVLAHNLNSKKTSGAAIG